MRHSTQAARSPLNDPRAVGARRRARRGLSLLELIVALAILAGTASMLMEMVDLGIRHAERAAQITEAQAVAHNLMQELLLGTRPLQSSEAFVPVDLWTPWEYRVQLTAVGFGQLMAVTLTVAPQPEQRDGQPVDQALQSLDPNAVRPGSYRLTRWIQPSRGRATSRADQVGEDQAGDVFSAREAVVEPLP